MAASSARRAAFATGSGPIRCRAARAGSAVEPGRYHLYVSLACPWCHRTAILRELAGLQEAVPISYLAPFRDERGWAFSGERFEDGPGGEYVDRLHGWRFMSEAYDISDPSFDGRITVPVLWDTVGGRIVNNESSDIVRMMSFADSLGGLGHGGELELYPQALRAGDRGDQRARVRHRQQRRLPRRLRPQPARLRARLRGAVRQLRLARGAARRAPLPARRAATEADWRLFPTLARFDEVYNLHFRCNRRRLVDYPEMWGYARELYQTPGVARTVAMDQIKRHYYTTHDELNPKRIIPVGPGYDWSQPHGRER